MLEMYLTFFVLSADVVICFGIATLCIFFKDIYRFIISKSNSARGVGRYINTIVKEDLFLGVVLPLLAVAVGFLLGSFIL